MPTGTGIIVQARMSSTRMPGKTLKKIGGYPLIYYVVKRLQLLKLPVVVCTSTNASDDVLCDYLEQRKWPYFRGSLENVLQRYIQTAEKFNVKNIVRITADNPFVDISFLKEALILFQKFSYADAIYKEGLIVGSGFELVKIEELKNIPSEEKNHLEHVTLYLRENLCASSKRISIKPATFNSYRPDVFLTCDYPEDFELISKIIACFNYRYDISLQEILQLIDENPSLKIINKFRHQRNPGSGQ